MLDKQNSEQIIRPLWKCALSNESKESKSQSILVDYDLCHREQSSEYRAGGDQSKGGYGGIHKETENRGVA